VTTLVDQTVEEFEQIIDFAWELHACAHKTNTVIAKGRARNSLRERLEPNAAIIVAWKRKRAEYEGRMRVTAETMFRYQIDTALAHSPIDPLVRGCPAGKLTCGILENGDIVPCSFFPDLVVGNVLRDGFSQVWRDSPELAQIRTARGYPACASCPHTANCGGCRARADSSGPDSSCCGLKRERA